MRKLLTFTAIALLATPALAARWQVDPVTSRILFKGDQAGETFEGSFPKFSSAITFDEAAPEKGSAHIAITMASAQIDGKDRADSLPTSDWFDVKQFPFAEFTATSFKKTGEHAYEAIGKLSIRGIEKPLVVPFKLDTVGSSATATGEVTLNRKDYGIGQGRWASEEWVKYPVTVSFEIHASRITK